jgi:hypothetical protein
MMTPKEFIQKQDDGYIAGDYTPNEVYQLMSSYAAYTSARLLEADVMGGVPTDKNTEGRCWKCKVELEEDEGRWGLCIDCCGNH